MLKDKKIWKLLYKIGVTFVYVAMIVVLVWQALTPGKESSNISNSVGNIIDQVITQTQKPEAERILVDNVTLNSFTLGKDTLSLEDLTLEVGVIGELKCKVLPENASNPSLLYQSSDTNVIVAYPDGKIEAVNTGVALVTVISQDNQNVQTSIKVTVQGIPLKSLELSSSFEHYYPDRTYVLDVSLQPKNTTERELEWSVSDENVLSIDQTGKIQTLKEGVATVTVTSKKHPTIYKTLEIVVEAEPEPEKIPVSSIKISSVKVDNQNLALKNFVLNVGKRAKLQCTVSPSNASNKSLLYKSSDESVLTIAEDGTMEGVKLGSAIVTITSQSDPEISVSTTITVDNIKLESLKITSKKNSIYVGQSCALELAFTPANTTERSIQWSTSDKTIATVSSSGTVKGVKVGTAVITATSKTNAEIFATFTIAITEKPTTPEIVLQEITLNATETNVKAGTKSTLGYTLSPTNATNKSVIWSTSDKTVATVTQSGVVSFLKEGDVTITVKSSSYEIQDQITFSVKEKLSQTITLEMEGLTQNQEEGYYELKLSTSALIHAILDKDATILDVEFSSSDESVATIGQDGAIVSQGKGFATITATSAYGQESVSASFTLRVVGLTPDVEEIQLSHVHENAYIGSTCALTANLLPLTSTDTLIWSSSNKKIATVTQGGVVTYHKAGTVTLTVKCSSYDVEESIDITVKEVLSKNIALQLKNLTKTDDGDFTMKMSTSGKVRATLDKNATVKAVQFHSSDEKVAKIGKDGTIEALGAGTTTITVSTSYDGETTQESFRLTVLPPSFRDTIANFSLWVRKSFGHFGAFLVLGIFAALTYFALFPKTTWGKLLAFAVCAVAGFAVAGLTEIFQLPIFTQGRHCSFDDVMLDFSGYCFSCIPISIGFLCAYFIPKCIEFVRKKKAIADAIPAPAFKETLIEAEMGMEMPTDAKPPVKALFKELSPTEMVTAPAEMVTASAEMMTAPAEAKERATNKENYEN